MEACPTIATMLRRRAADTPDGCAYRFLANAALDETAMTYGALDRKARAIASGLRRLGVVRRGTVLVVFPTGSNFLESFFGCLYAGAIAVPCRYPGPRDPLTHIAAVAADAGSAIGLTTRQMRPILAGQLDAVCWLAADDLDPGLAEDWQAAGGSGDDVAYLQYTSGSTAAPKGVVLRNRHVLDNCRDTERHLDIDRDSRIFSWLPHFHDFGLVFGRLQPLYSGCLGVLMSPTAFAQRPLRWLDAISRHRITHSGAPDFAYRSCLTIPEHQRRGLDLKNWRVAINGAEPVRAGTIEQFARAFAPHGFAAEAMCPGYGMAEATLIASVCDPGLPPTILDVEPEALRKGRLVPAGAGPAARTRLVASGAIDVETTIRIVDPKTGTPCGPGRIGEIWLAGPAVAAGYWNRPEASAARFSADLAGSSEGPFLRSRDLGAVIEGELFVLGRIDDLIIIRGVNHAAEDLELALEGCDPALQPDGGAVFAVDIADERRLIVAHEIERHALRNLDEGRVVKAIRRAISERHGLEVAAVVLLRPRALPRTHSGKKQRHGCRRGFLAGELRDVTTWIGPRLRAAWKPGAAAHIDIAPAAAAPAEPRRRAEQEGQEMQTFDGDFTDHVPLGAEPGRCVGLKAAARPETASQDRVEELNAWLRHYAGERINSFVMDERRSMPPYVVLDFGNRGLLGLQAPRRFGGLDLDNRSFARVIEQLAAIDLTLGSFVTVNNALGLRPILRHATAETREQWLPTLASGRSLAAFAMTEPGAGSHVRSITAEGRPDGTGGWRLFGTKIWSGSAAWAGVINTFVRTGEGVSGFMVRQGSAGLRMGPEALTMGLRAMVQNEIRLEGVRVAAADLLGEAGDGMTAAMDTMEFGRFCVAALSLGVIKRCLQIMLRHAGRRRISTGALLDNPVTLTRISDLTAAATAIEALIAVVGERLDRGLAVPAELFCACKTTGPEYAWRAADQLVQQLAGRGYIETNLAPQILRDTRILRIFEGPTEPMHMHIGSKLIHSPEELRRCIGLDLGQPTLGAEMEVAAARIAERCGGAGTRLADPTAARQWATILAGEVGAWGILLAAVKYQARLSPSPALRRAEDWARLSFDRRLAEALGATPAEAVLLGADEAEDIAAAYAASIGDIEQSMPGALWAPDPVVARDTRPPQSMAPPPDAAQPQAALDRPAPALAPAENPIIAWLTAWTAEAFDRPASSIAATDRFGEYGLDSVRAVMLINALEDWLGIEISRTLVWDYPSIEALADHLAGLVPPSAVPLTEGVRSDPAPRAPRGRTDAIPDRRRSATQDDIALLGQIDQLSEAELDSVLAQVLAAGPRQ